MPEVEGSCPTPSPGHALGSRSEAGVVEVGVVAGKVGGVAVCGGRAVWCVCVCVCVRVCVCAGECGV